VTTRSASETCPFAALSRQELAATPGLSPEDSERLEAHLATGCPVCEELFARALEAQVEGVPGLERAVEAAADGMAAAQAAVLARVEAALREDLLAARRTRRRHLRVLFWVFMSATSVLLLMAYVGLSLFVRMQISAAKRAETLVELRALTAALARSVQDTGEIPADVPALVQALSRPRPDGGLHYYPLEARRLRDGGYMDAFGRPYRYEPGVDRALIYSLGPDGKDDGGDPSRDVVPVPVIFTRRGG
jgi:hypothetical protein